MEFLQEVVGHHTCGEINHLTGEVIEHIALIVRMVIFLAVYT